MSVESYFINNHLNKVIIYGYCRPEDHTHYWIHHALFRALTAVLGTEVKVEWVDNTHSKPIAFFEQALIFTNVYKVKSDTRLPVVSNSVYLIHNHNPSKLQPLKYQRAIDSGHAMTYQVYRGQPEEGYLAIENEFAHFYSKAKKDAVLTWATDLLPHEIEANIEKIRQGVSTKIYDYSFVGSIWESNIDAFSDFVEAVVGVGKKVHQFGRLIKYRDVVRSWPSLISEKRNIDLDENQRITRCSHIAPAIQGYKQLDSPKRKGNYIPCRIFKNISYGAMGVTNNLSVHKMLNEKTIFDENLSSMVAKAEQWLESTRKTEDMLELMEIVKRDHTYVNRINSMVYCLNELSISPRRQRVHYDRWSFLAKSVKCRTKILLKRFKQTLSFQNQS
ncbi:hypothetical protein SAMN02745866_00018 [Alteromonadaceae bacterium Bs31]|nr:hypothetical protein SAMN02745866_00018 [Alteromonadaceae bacterium Bs31]